MEVMRAVKTIRARNPPPVYLVAPAKGEIPLRLEDILEYAIDRITVLEGVADGLAKKLSKEQMEKLVKQLWRDNFGYPLGTGLLEADIASHFFLRLLYSQMFPLRKWFLEMEGALFEHRFEFYSVKEGLAQFGIAHCGPIDWLKQQKEVQDKMISYARSNKQLAPTLDQLFKIPLTPGLHESLQGTKGVFTHSGYAYLRLSQLMLALRPLFNYHVSQGLVASAIKSDWIPKFKNKEECDRLMPRINVLVEKAEKHFKARGRGQQGTSKEGTSSNQGTSHEELLKSLMVHLTA